MSNVQKLLWLSIIIIICVAGGFVYNYTNKPTVTEREQCTIESPVWCDSLIEWLQVKYNNLSKQQAELSKKADVYRAIKRLEISPSTTGEIEKLI